MLFESTKENPLSEVNLAEDSDQGAGIATLDNRLERYAVAHRRALAMAHYLTTSGEIKHGNKIKYRKLGAKLKKCGDWLVFRHYFTVDQVRLYAADFCKKHIVCPFCGIRRGAKYLKAYTQKLACLTHEKPTLKPYLVTFTVKDGPDLLERYNHLAKGIRTMMQARRDYLKSPKNRPHCEAAKATAGVYSNEFKRGMNSGLWHPHSHMVWLCHDAPNKFKLSEEWRKYTGDSFIVDVTPFYSEDDIIKGFCEVFKYAVKFSDLPLSDNLHAFEVLGGKRLVGSFGDFRGVEVPENLEDEILEDDLPFIEMFYKFTTCGYSLVKAVEGDIQADKREKEMRKKHKKINNWYKTRGAR